MHDDSDEQKRDQKSKPMDDDSEEQQGNQISQPILHDNAEHKQDQRYKNQDFDHQSLYKLQRERHFLNREKAFQQYVEHDTCCRTSKMLFDAVLHLCRVHFRIIVESCLCI